MKHCIIAKFNESVVDKPAAIESVKALFASAAPIEGVNGIVIHENCVERDNRYDLIDRRGDGEGRPCRIGTLPKSIIGGRISLAVRLREKSDF